MLFTYYLGDVNYYPIIRNIEYYIIYCLAV